MSDVPGDSQNPGRRQPGEVPMAIPVPPPVAVPDPEPAEEPWYPRFLEGSPAEAVLRYSDVRSAYEADDPVALREVLERRAGAAGGQERTAFEAALAERRVFGTEHFTKPSLGSLNGVGTGMYGFDAFDQRDHTYLKTYCFSFFWIPVFPFSQFLVQDAEGGGWYFVRKVPLGRFHRIWRAGVIAALAIAVLVAGFAFVHESNHSDVHVLNGLDYPVQVTIGEAEFTVPPGGRAGQSYERGSYPVVTVGPDGGILEEFVFQVPGGTDLVVYNVLGAAPLYTETLFYGGKSNRPPVWSFHGGSNRVTRDSVDYVFEEPPDEISSSKSGVETRVQAAMLDGGWRTTVETMAIDMEKPASAIDLGAKIALLRPGKADGLGWLIDMARELEATARLPELIEALESARKAAGRK